MMTSLLIMMIIIIFSLFFQVMMKNNLNGITQLKRVMNLMVLLAMVDQIMNMMGNCLVMKLMTMTMMLLLLKKLIQFYSNYMVM